MLLGGLKLSQVSEREHTGVIGDMATMATKSMEDFHAFSCILSRRQ